MSHVVTWHKSNSKCGLSADYVFPGHDGLTGPLLKFSIQLNSHPFFSRPGHHLLQVSPQHPWSHSLRWFLDVWLMLYGDSRTATEEAIQDLLLSKIFWLCSKAMEKVSIKWAILRSGGSPWDILFPVIRAALLQRGWDMGLRNKFTFFENFISHSTPNYWNSLETWYPVL